MIIRYESKFRLIEERYEIHTGFFDEITSCKQCESHEYNIENLARFIREENGDVLICFKLKELSE